MTKIIPIQYKWTGEVMAPLGRYHNQISQYTTGEIYTLAPVAKRSRKSHDHFFAALPDAHSNLPERLMEEFPDIDHLRKYALIKTGWYVKKFYVLISNDEAMKLAIDYKGKEPFSIIEINDTTVTIFTPRSQKMGGEGMMSPDDFQKSKKDAMEFIEDMIGVPHGTFFANLGKDA